MDRLLSDRWRYAEFVTADYVRDFSDVIVPVWVESSGGQPELRHLRASYVDVGIPYRSELDGDEYLVVAADGTVSVHGEALAAVIDSWQPREVVPRTLQTLIDIYGVRTSIAPEDADTYVRITGGNLVGVSPPMAASFIRLNGT